MGALDGVRVIDFGQYVAGPLAAMLLADQGADVVRVDPPGGPRMDTAANATWNRGKRSIVLDLKRPDDRDAARRLVAGADVLVENFRPGVLRRLGLGPDAMTAANPRLVYCSLPGFASDDPRAGLAAWEGVVAAATATYRPQPQTGSPAYTALPISSAYAALQAAVAVAAALCARERDGVGQVIEVPLFDATFGAIGYQGLRVHEGGPVRDLRALRRRMGIYGQLECRDGRWVMYMGGNLRSRAFLEARGAAEWVDAASEGTLSAEELAGRAAELFRTRTAQEWEDFCAEIGTECAVCRTSAEWLDEPGARLSEIVVDLDDPVLGRVRGPGINVRMSESTPVIRAPRARLDAHHAEILSELSRRDEVPAPASVDATLRSALDGVRVIDLCIILAGPTAGRTLAELGADVIKIDAPQRPAGPFHMDVNRGKRSLVLDLKREAGLDVFWRLVESADVLVQNFRNGVAERLGFGYEAVRARRPDIVYASLNAYGQVGPLAGRPGHEQIAQAATGMQERYGGDGTPTLAPFAINDYGTGYMGAYAIALALLHRKRTGRGQHVDTALAYTATLLQSSLLQSYPGRKWDEPRGLGALGSGPLHRAYRTLDDWIFVAAREPADLARCPELADLAALAGAPLASALEQRLGSRGAEHWIARLERAGVGVHRVVPAVAELMEDPWAQSHGLSVTRAHAGVGAVTTTGPALRLSRTPALPGRPAPRPGADAVSILSEIGMRDELDRLVREGALVVDAAPDA